MHINSFCHSGTAGDLIYSLPLVQHFGGGEFYIHLNQIEWMSQHYYNAPLPEGHFHKGRMNERDFELMRGLLEAQPYITKVGILDPSTTAVTHNLDRFRDLFVRHPGNYVDVYSTTFGITSDAEKEELRGTPWITVPDYKTVEGRDIAINRTARWLPPRPSPIWTDWKEQGVEDRAFFLGLPEEHHAFQQATGWNIPYQPTKDLLELAQYIAGAKVFIGNQSVALSIAIGFGHDDIWCEARRDLPIERNECYFPQQHGLNYF